MQCGCGRVSTLLYFIHTSSRWYIQSLFSPQNNHLSKRKGIYSPQVNDQSSTSGSSHVVHPQSKPYSSDSAARRLTVPIRQSGR